MDPVREARCDRLRQLIREGDEIALRREIVALKLEIGPEATNDLWLSVQPYQDALKEVREFLDEFEHRYPRTDFVTSLAGGPHLTVGALRLLSGYGHSGAVDPNSTIVNTGC
jgi:hypothetical protein